ncbi:VOC family protein [Neobacillus mesonae]|uniref:VOC family protein n=1 Tax=Neobacillus mesonae TaxID=1193713 RepID=UPI00203ACD8E|nr:VOC family protein [Neobacillus mesonae]MCM3568239.1 VOC family protein [Neobacillus mesonae]
MSESISQFAYIAIAVKNLEKAASFFADTFGGVIHKYGGVESEGYKDVFVKIGNFNLYLMEPLKEDSVIGRYIAKHGEGIHHICFKYEDYHKAVAGLKEKDLQILERNGDFSFVHPKDAFGVLIELAPVPNSPQ